MVWGGGDCLVYPLGKISEPRENRPDKYSRSFCEDVVLDSFNIAHRNEDIILDQIYQKQLLWDLYYEDFKFESDCLKCI